jgi:hypothetical protein
MTWWRNSTGVRNAGQTGTKRDMSGTCLTLSHWQTGVGAGRTGTTGGGRSIGCCGNWPRNAGSKFPPADSCGGFFRGLIRMRGSRMTWWRNSTGVRNAGQTGSDRIEPGLIRFDPTGKAWRGPDRIGSGVYTRSDIRSPDAPLTTAPITLYRTGPSGGFTGRGARSPDFSTSGENYGIPKAVFPQTVNRKGESVK